MQKVRANACIVQYMQGRIREHVALTATVWLAPGGINVCRLNATTAGPDA